MPVSNVRASIIGVLAFIFGAVLMVPVLHQYGAFEPTPYRVTDVTHWREDGLVRVRVRFIKDDCEYERGVIWGTYFGEVDPRPLTWRNIPGNIGDRTKGEHTADLVIGPLRQPYERIEMRTRHDCDGEKVDRVFFRIDLK